MTASSFVSELKKIVNTQKTVYAWGMFGTIITKTRIDEKVKQYPYWYTKNKINSIFAPLYNSSIPVFGFDCVGLVKSVLWGFCADPDKTYGGAVYGSCGVPDVSADAMICKCLETSTDFSSIAIGEFVWLKGHCGIYIGNGQVVESTPKWNNGVQITALSARKWLKHGKLPWVEYGENINAEGVTSIVTIELPVLKCGSKGREVKSLQRLLKALSYKGSNGKALTIDGAFGANTEYALKAYQHAEGLTVDGICGKNSWNSILK